MIIKRKAIIYACRNVLVTPVYTQWVWICFTFKKKRNLFSIVKGQISFFALTCTWVFEINKISAVIQCKMGVQNIRESQFSIRVWNGFQ